MTYTPLPKLKKNSPGTTLTAGIADTATTIPVAELAYFHDVDGTLITAGIVIGADNANETYAEEITITGASGVSGAGTLTGATRGVNADGTIGAARAWDSGTQIAVMITTGIYGKIRGDLIAKAPYTSLPNRNAIINGDCRVNQRVTAYTLVKDAYTWDSSDLYGPDRHEGMATGTAVSAGTWGQSTTCIAGNSGYGFKFAGVTLTGTGILYHRHRIEAKDAVRFKNQIASFGCKVWHDVGSNINYTIYIRKANAADNFSAVTAISNSGAISVPTATATTLKYENVSMGDCSNGIEIEIKIEAGTVTLKNFCQTELQLELGSVVTEFEFIPYVQAIAGCLRYAYALGPYGAVTNYHPYGLKAQTATIEIPILFRTRMRVPPTLFTSSPAPVTVNPSGNQYTIYDRVAAGRLTPTTTVTISIASGTQEFTPLFFVASTSWDGSIGDGVFLQLGSTCSFIFSSEL